MVKIAIKVGILIIVLVVMFLAFNLFFKKVMNEKILIVENKIKANQAIQGGLGLMLNHKDSWAHILAAQKRDMEYIRSVLPAAPFTKEIYLRALLDVFHKSGVYSSHMVLKRPGRPGGGVNYFQYFTPDMVALSGYIKPFDEAFVYLQKTDKIKGQDIKRIDSLVLGPNPTDEDLELSLWYSFRFNQQMAVDLPEGVNLRVGLGSNRFETTVTGSYEDIKHFLWSTKNMRPHTVILNWHLSPGSGMGEGRGYSANLTLLTFVDHNIQPRFEHDPNDPYFPIYEALPDLPDISFLLRKLGFPPP